MEIDVRNALSGRGLLVAGLTAAVLATGGTATAFAAQDDDDPPASSRVTAAQAAEAALKAAPGRIEELELDDDDDGRAVWEADVLADDGTWRNVDVDANSGKATLDRKDDDAKDDAKDDASEGDDDAKDEGASEGDDGAVREALKGAKVSAVQAADIALKAAPGTVTSVDFERSKWEVDVTGKDGKEREVAVDPASGKVLENVLDED